MGCDIHAFVEYGSETYYKTFCKIFLDRHYALFSVLADVRTSDGFPAICAPKGAPANLSFRVADCLKEWEGDAHSESWLTVDEVRLACSRVESQELKIVLEIMEGLPGARFVFWFDN